jgi:DNA-binding response OmpR family regulator
MKSAPRVLILEDERLIAILLADWVKELRCEMVGPAHTVSQALELIGSNSLNAAILDVSVGDQSCAPAADLLRSRGVPFAFATGRRADEILDRYPGTPVLSKPYEFETIRSALSNLLGGLPS